MNKVFIATIGFLVVGLLAVGAVSFFLVQKSSYSETVGSPETTKEYQVKKYQTANLYQSMLEKCPDKSFSCFEKSTEEITKAYGPEASLDILRLLEDKGLIEKTVDDHQIAHVVGRDTANFFGINAEAFLSCPTSFNYGCQHGYFEAALVKVKPAKKAIDLICGSLGDEYSSKFKFYCYHGVGHGVMDAESYNLKASLDVCDTLDSVGRDGCWQGVFMENVNAGMRGEARSNIFSKTDPLAPCNQVQDQYRHECYINHSGWLMTFFHNDEDKVGKAVAACLKAGNYINACLQSIGLMVTNPVWQPALLKNIENKDSTEVAKEICLKFPKNYQEQCVVAGVDNILNFDELNTKRAQKFCDIVGQDFQNSCYRHIGISLKSQTTDNNIVLQKCSAFADNFKKECLLGAGL